jgi:hypothetical protein
MTEEEGEWIHDYTRSGYHSMNEDLRSGDSPKDSEDTEAIQNALLKAPPPPPGLEVYRSVEAGEAGTDTNVFETMKAGDMVKLDGFQSTSIDPEQATKFGEIKMRIKPKTGAYVEALSDQAHEHEFLIPHGRTFKVVSRVKDGKNLWLNLEEQ